MKTSICRHCHETIAFSTTVKDEWSHWHLDTYCHTPNGFCATPLKRATPVLHDEDVPVL